MLATKDERSNEATFFFPGFPSGTDNGKRPAMRTHDSPFHNKSKRRYKPNWDR